MKVRDEEFYRAIGAMGGQATLARHGIEHFEKCGQKGGKALVERYGTKRLSEVARMPRGKRGAPRVAKEPPVYTPGGRRGPEREAARQEFGYDVYGDGLDLIG